MGTNQLINKPVTNFDWFRVHNEDHELMNHGDLLQNVGRSSWWFVTLHREQNKGVYPSILLFTGNS